MTSPWNQIAQCEAASLVEIMSEQYAHGLQSREDKLFSEQLAASQEQQEIIDRASADDGDGVNAPEINAEAASAAAAASVAAASAPTCTAADTDESATNAPLDADTAAAIAAINTCASDEAIAAQLQAEFDLCHDDELRRLEQHQNGGSKVSVSFAHLRRTKPSGGASDDDDDAAAAAARQPGDPLEARHWDRFERNERIFSGMSKKGFTYDADGIRITKHDAQLNGVRNAGRIMSFPPEIQTGDTAGFDMQLPNGVYNQLKTFSHKAKRFGAGGGHHGNAGSGSGVLRQDRREEHATTEMGVDAKTAHILLKLINKGTLERVNGVISTGKEAIVLHADGMPGAVEMGDADSDEDNGNGDDYADDDDDGTETTCSSFVSKARPVPVECAVKVFKMNVNEFKQRDRYINDDYRFRDRIAGKQNNPEVIKLWAEKEWHNLARMRHHGIRCPAGVVLKDNVLVMEFVGEGMVAALKLKEVRLSPMATRLAYEDVVRTMHKMYNEANLVHADLSEYNILWHDCECWYIDVAQAVEPKHPGALEFLMRDCRNITTFFTRRGVADVKTKEELFQSITKLDPFAHTTTMLERLQNKGPNEALSTSNRLEEIPEHLKPVGFHFDYAWDAVQRAKEEKQRAAAAAKAAAEAAADDDDESDEVEGAAAVAAKEPAAKPEAADDAKSAE